MKGSVTPVLTDPIIGSELIFAVKGKTNYMIPIDDLVAAASFAPGVEPEFFSWDKTWRQIDYSMLSGTPALVENFGDLGDVPDYTSADALKFIRVNSSYSGLEYATVNVDLSNYVTIDGEHYITGKKTFTYSGGLYISRGSGYNAIRIAAPYTNNSFTGTLTMDSLSDNQVWLLPNNKSGTIALLDDLTSLLEKATSTDINTGTDDAKYVTSLSIRNSNIFSAEKAGQFSTLTEKTSITANDAFVVEHASGGAKQLLKWSIIKAHNDNLYYGNVAGQFNATVEKTTLTNADLIIIEDSASTPTAYAKKKASWTNIKVFLKTYFDNIYYGNVAGQFNATTNKSTIVSDDIFIIEDSEALNAKKSLKWSSIVTKLNNLFFGGSANQFSALTEKTATASDDIFVIEDSQNTFNKKKYKVGTLIAALSSIFASLTANNIFTGANIFRNGYGIRVARGATSDTIQVVPNPAESAYTLSLSNISLTEDCTIFFQSKTGVVPTFDDLQFTYSSYGAQLASGAAVEDSVVLLSSSWIYYGSPITDGTWRSGRSGTGFIHQRRESGSWVTKQTIST